MSTPSTIRVAKITIAPGTPVHAPEGHMQRNEDGSTTLTHRTISKVTQSIIEDQNQGMEAMQKSRRRWMIACGVCGTLTLASLAVITWLATSLGKCNKSP